MKRILLLLVLLFSLAGASYAQVYYRCTGQNVRVRTAPSLKSGMMQYNGAQGCSGPVYLDKGTIVRSLGVQRNGFAKVQDVSNYIHLWDPGWVSMQYLVRAQRCSNCGGKGHFNQVCPGCDGLGRLACCDGTGKKPCSKCYGIGYR